MDSQLPAKPSPAQRSKYTILNINDEDAIRYVLSRMLKSAGYTVMEAATGQDGIVSAVTLPSLILLDVQLPDIHGFEVCEMVKANPITAGIPVLMISANFVRPSDKQSGLLSGADGYLTHPVSPHDLLAAVDDLLSLTDDQP